MATKDTDLFPTPVEYREEESEISWSLWEKTATRLDAGSVQWPEAPWESSAPLYVCSSEIVVEPDALRVAHSSKFAVEASFLAACGTVPLVEEYTPVVTANMRGPKPRRPDDRVD